MVLLTTNGMAVDDMTAAPSGPGLAKGLGDQVDAFYGGNVANAAALPASGKFLGQRIWLIDVKGFAVWSGTGWNYDRAAVTPTYTSPWADLGGPDVGTRVELVNGWIHCVVAATKSAASTSNETIFTLPSWAQPRRQFRIFANNAGTGRALTVSTSGAVTNDVAQSAGLAAVVGSASWPAKIA